MNPADGPSYIAIARIVRTRGNRGEVLAELHTDFPTRFSHLPRVWVAFQDGRRENLALESCWQYRGREVLKFGGIDTITAAEALVGAWVEVAADQAVTLPEGTYWDRDLVGCSVHSTGGEVLGTVTEVMRVAGNHQLVVQGEHGEFLVPAVGAICREISISRKEIVVDLPEGLMDLNR